MTERSIFDEVPDEISVQLVSFSEAIDNVQSLVAEIATLPNDLSDKVSNVDRIKSELSLCYAANALFFIYLKCNGANTENHLIKQELERIMVSLKRCRGLVEKGSSPRVKIDKEASARVVKHSLWQSAHSKSKKL